MKEKYMKTFLFLTLMLLTDSSLGQQLVGIQATVEPSTVNAQNTKLRLFGSIRTSLESSDYFLVTLPQQVSVIYSDLTPGVNQLQCQFLEPADLKITSCESLSSTQIKLVIADTLADYFQFDILQAITNPPSTTFTGSVKLETFRGANQTLVDFQSQDILIAATNDTLSALKMSGTVTQNAGSRNTLEFTIRTKNPILFNGMVQVQFPLWFEVAQENIRLHHVDAKSLQCMELASKMIITCSYDTKTRTVSLTTLVGSAGRPSLETLKFSIRDVFNPISTDSVSLLTVRTTDQVGGVIDQGQVQFRANLPNLISNVKLTADSSLVQELTNYTLQFSIGVPLYQGDCPLTIYLPYPDFRLTSTAGVLTDVQGIGLFGQLRSYQYQINPSDNSILIKDACSQGYILPQIPATIYLMGLRNPEVAKLTEPIRIKLYTNGLQGEAAELPVDRSPQFQITTGQVLNLTLTTSQTKINSLTEVSLRLIFQNQAISDAQSVSQLARLVITFEDVDFSVMPEMVMTGSSLPGGQVTLESVDLTTNSLIVLIQSPQIKPQTWYQVDFSGLKLAGSKQTMGPLRVELLRQWFATDGMPVYYPINNGTFAGLINTDEGKFLRAEIYPSSWVVYSPSTYRFEMLLENPIPPRGYVQIDLPSQISIIGGAPQCKVDGNPITCTLSSGENQTIKLTGPFLDKAYGRADGPLNFEITNIRNPRSTRTTDPFIFRSFDSADLLIDVYKESNTALTMTKPLNFTTAGVSRVSSLRVSDTNVSYTFEVRLAMRMDPGDYLTVGVPLTDEIAMPEFPLARCESTTQKSLVCTQSVDKTIRITLSDAVDAGSPLEIILGPFTNPSSGKLTGPFRLAAFDRDAFKLAITVPEDTVTEVMLGVQMRDPYLIKDGAAIIVNNDIPTAPVEITIQLFIKNPIEPGSKLVVNYPFQVGVNASAVSVYSPQSSSLAGVKLITAKRQVVGENFFSVFRQAGSYLELQLTGFKNPATGAAPSDIFSLDIYTPEGFVIDRLEQGNLTVKSRCDYPCKDCSQGSSVCDSCLSSDLTNLILLEQGKCVESCRTGFYQIGNICDKCSPSCQTCDISPQLCTSCPQEINKPTFLFNNRCVSACDSGYFRNDADKICEQCKSPCQSCDTDVNSCTTCKSGYYLYRGTCRQQCPEDYFINNATSWQCDRCINDCQTCQRTVDQCMSCKPGFKLNLLNSTCFVGECPAGVTTEEQPGICGICKPKCATCGQNNTGYCLTCSSNLFLTPDNDCVVQCKPNQAIIVGEDGIRRCQPCKEGCAKCLDGNPSVCQVCETGLVNFNFSQCLTACPQEYFLNNKSGNCLDGRIQCKYGFALNEKDECELTVQECSEGYILNTVLDGCIPVPGFYVPFPILGGMAIITLIFIATVKCGKKKSQTKLIPSIIVLWSFFELPIFIAQVYLAADFGHQLNIIFVVLAIGCHFPVNYYAVKSVLPAKLIQDLTTHEKSPKLRKQASNAAGDHESTLDQTFKHWAIDHRKFIVTLRRLALLYNHKLLRCLTCNFNGRPQFAAVFENLEHRYNRPMLRVAFANIICSYLLISIADVTALKQIVYWGYQFTIVCIESLIFLCLLSILEIVDWYLNKGGGTQYFKVDARGMRENNVFGDMEEDGGFKRQKSFEHHVSLLKQLNEQLESRKIYSGNFDKLADYCRNDIFLNDSALKGGKLRHKLRAIRDEPEGSESDLSDGCLSTQNHYAWNKADFFQQEYKDRLRDTQSENDMDQNPNYREQDWVRQVKSVISETDYGDPQRLYDFREELDGRFNDDGARSKTLDYKASFHILDPNPLGISASELEAIDAATQAGDYLMQRPPRHNLIDVMGHFETDLEGNFILIKRLAPNGRDQWVVDALGRRVNKRGYLVDDEDNIVNKYGELVLQRQDLDSSSGDIPADVFADLFIPKQISKAEADPIFKKKPRVQTGKQRPTPPLIIQNQSGEGSLQARSKATRQAKASRKNIMTESRMTIGGGQVDYSSPADHQFDSQMYILQNDHSRSQLSQGGGAQLNSVSSQKTLAKDRSRHPPRSSSKKRAAAKDNDDQENTDGEDSLPHNRTIDHGLPAGLNPDPSQSQLSPGKDLVNLDVQPEFEKEGRRVFSPKRGKKKHRKIQMSKTKQAEILDQKLPVPLPSKKTANSAQKTGSDSKPSKKPGVPRFSQNKVTPLLPSKEKPKQSDLGDVLTPDDHALQHPDNSELKPEEIKEKEKLDAMIKIISKPTKDIIRSVSHQKRVQYQAPLPKRRPPKHDMMLDNGLFFINANIEDQELDRIAMAQRPMSAVQSNQTGKPPRVLPNPGFLDISQSSNNMLLEHTQRDEIDRRDFSGRRFAENSSVDLLPAHGPPPGGISTLTLSGRLQLRENASQERHRVSVDRFYRDQFAISPTSSLNHQTAALMLAEGRRVNPSVTSIHHTQQKQLNKVSGAYRQDLTKLMRQQNRSAEKEDPNDPFVQLKRIFNRK